MKISKFFFLLFIGLGIIIWSLNTSCTNKQVSNSIDPTFKNVSSLLVSKCAKCHGDSVKASYYGGNNIYDFSNYYSCVLDSVGSPYFRNYDTTASGGYDITSFGGSSFLDIQGIGSHPMPLGGPSLNDNEIEAIRKWLFKGAPNN